jgi:hypothetical protein
MPRQRSRNFDLEALQVFGDPQFLRKRPSRAFALATRS